MLMPTTPSYLGVPDTAFSIALYLQYRRWVSQKTRLSVSLAIVSQCRGFLMPGHDCMLELRAAETLRAAFVWRLEWRGYRYT